MFDGKSQLQNREAATVAPKIKGKKWTLGVRVLDEAAYDLVLGLPWIRRAKPKIDWTTLRVDLGPTEINVGLIGVSEIERVDEIFPVFVNMAETSTSKGTLPPELADYADVVNNDPINALPPARPGFDMVIETNPDAKIPCVPPYKHSQYEGEAIDEIIREGLAKGHIDVTNSPYAAPVLVIKKPDGSMRLCVDYRQLNKITVRDSFPIPDIVDLLDSLRVGRIFTTLDLVNGFNQLRIDPKYAYKTAFRTRYGHYEWRVVPFGLKNAPSVFSKYLTKVLSPFMGKSVVLYIDDILIFSKDREAHVKDVRAVLQALRENSLRVKLKKADFFKSEVTFLGFRVDSAGVAILEDKVKPLMDWPSPLKDRNEVQRFLGLAGWFR